MNLTINILLGLVCLVCVGVALFLQEGVNGKKDMSNNGVLLWGASALIFVCVLGILAFINF